MTHADRLPPRTMLAFAPLHKRAFGLAIGTAAGAVLLVLTLVGVLRGAGAMPAAEPLSLLGEYFTGYDVSLIGAVIGFAWAFGTGFIFGWFLAFVRNLVLAGSVFWIRTRAEFNTTRDFLDHI